MKHFYRRLSKCVLSLTLLLNRKRTGEIQYLKTTTYNKVIPQNQQDEFLQVLSEAEKTLTKKFKLLRMGKAVSLLLLYFPKIYKISMRI